MSSPKPLVWFITGCSTGFGAELAKAALARGDKVIATARKIESIQYLMTSDDIKGLQLDVTQPLEELKSIAEEGQKLFGRFDVLVNNAGYRQVGLLEEASPEETFNQFNANVFGLLNVTRAILPYLRSQRSGTIINVGSVVSRFTSPAGGLYSSTKYALSGLTEALSKEVEGFGIRVAVVEPSFFATSILTPSSSATSGTKQSISDYNTLRAFTKKREKERDTSNFGDPAKAANKIIDLVRGEGGAKGKDWPLRVALGADAHTILGNANKADQKRLDEWEDFGKDTAFDK